MEHIKRVIYDATAISIIITIAVAAFILAYSFIDWYIKMLNHVEDIWIKITKVTLVLLAAVAFLLFLLIIVLIMDLPREIILVASVLFLMLFIGTILAMINLYILSA